MAQVPFIDDNYINEIIKAAEAYNPALNKTQGVKLRELIKRLRDRMEQNDADAVRTSGNQVITGTKSFTQISTEDVSFVKNGFTSVLKNPLNQNQHYVNTLPRENGELALTSNLNKSGVGLGNVDNTSDADKPISVTQQNALNLKLNTSEKGTANGVASLGVDGKIPNGQLPSIALTETFVTASQTAMLALSQAEMGDVAIRTDIKKSFILQQGPASVLANWIELLSPSLGSADNLPEGTTNLYFTQAKARAALSAGSGITYAATTGLITNSAPNLPSNLTLGTRTATEVPITNSNGTGLSLPAATAALAGAMSGIDKAKLDGIGDYRQYGLGASLAFSDYNTAPAYTFGRNGMLNTANAPTPGAHSVWTTASAGDLSTLGGQLALGYSTTAGGYASAELYIRSKSGATTWNSWKTIADKQWVTSNFAPAVEGGYLPATLGTSSVAATKVIGTIDGTINTYFLDAASLKAMLGLKSGAYQDNGSATLNASQWNGFSNGFSEGIFSAGLGTISILAYSPENAKAYRINAGYLKAFLGLGLNAYDSTSYLPLSGGTLTGVLNGTSGVFSNTLKAINHFADGLNSANRGYQFNTSGSARFYIYTDTVSESGGNVGSNLNISRYSDTGAYLGNPLVISRTNGNVTLESTLNGAGATFTGNVTSNSTFVINRPSGSVKALFAQTSGVNRWIFGSNGDVESGNGDGSNFIIGRFNDAGVAQGNAMILERLNGNAIFGGQVTSRNINLISTTNYNYPTLGTLAGSFKISNGTGTPNLYGLSTGIWNNGDTWMQVGRFDGTAMAYHLILQSAGGNVGIGTTLPSAKAHVKGTFKIERSIQNQYTQIDHEAGATSILSKNTTSTDYSQILFLQGNNATTDREIARFDVNGRFLIGETVSGLGVGTLSVSGTAVVGSTSVNTNNTKLFIRNYAGKHWALSSGLNNSNETDFGIYNWSDDMVTPMFSINSGGRSTFTCTSGGAILTLKSNLAGATSNFMQYLNSNGVRMGYIGYGSTTNTNLILRNDLGSNVYSASSHTFDTAIYGTGLTLSGIATAADFSTNTLAPSNRGYYMKVNGLLRWGVQINDVAETGANLGSNFQIQRFDDAGNSLGLVMGISRSTGAVSFNTSVTAPVFLGNLTGNATTASLATTANGLGAYVWSAIAINSADFMFGRNAANEIRPISNANVKTSLALNNVDNTSDLAKPVSTAAQSALNTKANVAGQTFTGEIKGPDGTTATSYVTRQQVPALIAQGTGVMRILEAAGSALFYSNDEFLDIGAVGLDYVFTIPAGTFQESGRGLLSVKMAGSYKTTTSAANGLNLYFKQGNNSFVYNIFNTGGGTPLFKFNSDITFTSRESGGLFYGNHNSLLTTADRDAYHFMGDNAVANIDFRQSFTIKVKVTATNNMQMVEVLPLIIEAGTL